MKNIILYLLGKKGYEVLRAAIDHGYIDNISQVVIGNDKGVDNDFSSEIILSCIKFGIDYVAREDEILNCNQRSNMFAFAAGWRWIVKGGYRQIIVIHDSLLPKYRGFNPLVTAMLQRDKEVGISALIATDDYDKGEIISNRKVKITYPTKISYVVDQIIPLYFDMAREIFQKLDKSNILFGKKQIEKNATYSIWRDEIDYRIHWNQSANEILHFINSVSFPYKGSSSLLGDILIRILEAEVVPDVHVVNRDVGKVIFNIKNKPVVICQSGLLKITVAVDENGNNALPFKKFRTRLI